MADRDVALFEAIAGGLLEDLGYERRHTASPGRVRLAARWAEVKWSARRGQAAFKGRFRRLAAR
jgi:hypothetical protein